MATGGKKHPKRSGATVRTSKKAPKMKKIHSISNKRPQLGARASPTAHSTRPQAPKRPDLKGAKTTHRHGTLNSLWRNQLLGEAGVRSWLIRSVGENSIHVIQEFESQMSDEEIAQKSGIRASEVRVVLNKLHSFGLATYVRNRDRNSGWYSYVWKLNNEHVPEVLALIKKESAEETVVVEVPDDGKEHYGCKVCGPTKQFDFDQASGLMFRCDQCGQNLQFLERK
jgi:Transcription initiation factor IIE, alpha subunit